MKKLFSFAIVACITTLGFVACNKKATAPEIVFGESPAEATVKFGETKDIPVSIKAEGKLKEIRYFRKTVDTSEEIPFGNPITKFNNKSKYESVVTLREISDNFILVVEAIDKKGKATKAEFKINVEGSETHSAYHDVQLGFNYLQTIGSSLSAKSGKVFLLADAKNAQSEIDLMFFYGVINGVSVAAPSDNVVTRVFNNANYGTQTWGTRNSTILAKVDVDFDKATLSDIQQQLTDSNRTLVNHLNASDVVAFKTASGQIGVVQLAHVGSNSASTLNVNVRVLGE